MSVELWFPSPIYHSHIAEPIFSEVQKEFEHVYEDLKSKHSFGVPDGWSGHLISDPTFTKNLIDDYDLNHFKEELHIHILKYLEQITSNIGTVRPANYKITTSWMTQTNKGQYAHTHTHGDADISGCYYFKTNGEDGSIFFEGPAKQLASSYCFRHTQSKIYYKPIVGRLLLFPGSLEHGVETNFTDNERVSVSFNISFNRI